MLGGGEGLDLRGGGGRDFVGFRRRPKVVVGARQLLCRLEPSVDQLVEIFIMGEDDVASHVVEEAFRGAVGAGEASRLGGLRGGKEFFFLRKK